MFSSRQRTGFTIVELLVVIIVIAILAVVIVVAFNGITRRANVADLQTSMKAVVKAMESDKSTTGSYPSSIPGSLIVSTGIKLNYFSGDPNNYCINGTSRSDSNMKMFVSNTDTEPKYGTCTTGEDASYNPYTSASGPAIGAVGWTSLIAGGNHTCASYDNVLYCWGWGAYGRLGNGQNVDIPTPSAVNTTTGVGGGNISYITAGTGATCVIDSSNKAYCWGANGTGAFGTGIHSLALFLR